MSKQERGTPYEDNFMWYFWRWVSCLCYCIGGFLGTITLGFWTRFPGCLILECECWFLDYCQFGCVGKRAAQKRREREAECKRADEEQLRKWKEHHEAKAKEVKTDDKS